jgi:hypothetical protein
VTFSECFEKLFGGKGSQRYVRGCGGTKSYQKTSAVTSRALDVEPDTAPETINSEP